MTLNDDNSVKFIKNTTWVDEVAGSIPDHSVDVKRVLLEVMSDDTINEVDRHGCALAAAIVSGNGELAFEISMNGPLLGTDEREVAKSAASVATMKATYNSFLSGQNVIRDVDYNEFDVCVKDTFGGVAPSKFQLYKFVSNVVLNSPADIEESLTEMNINITSYQLKLAAKIAAVVSAIGKVAI